MKRIIGLLIPFLLTGCSADRYSVGVIGGADGPTSITVSSTLNPWPIAALIAAAAIVLIVLICRKKRK